MQQLGLPAVRVKSTSAEVIEFNKLFSSLVNATPLSDHRCWFVDYVLSSFSPADRTRWETALADQTPEQVQVAFKSVNGQALNFEMRSVSSLGPKNEDHSILCVFIPFTNPTFERTSDALLSEGRELERSRIREELHDGASQSLLGAAFCCKLLAGKVGKLNESLGKDVSDLAELLNNAVMELQNLLHSE
jgi:signal transduction histidine kinase